MIPPCFSPWFVSVRTSRYVLGEVGVHSVVVPLSGNVGVPPLCQVLWLSVATLVHGPKLVSPVYISMSLVKLFTELNGNPHHLQYNTGRLAERQTYCILYVAVRPATCPTLARTVPAIFSVSCVAVACGARLERARARLGDI